MILSELFTLPEETLLANYTLVEGGPVSDFLITVAPAFSGTTLTVKELKDYFNSRPDDEHKSILLAKEIIEPAKAEPTPPPVIHPEAINAIAKPDRHERIIRQVIGGLFSFVLAFTILAFTAVVVLVCVEKKELPSATLAAIIILPTMMVTWYYMGIINRERRDILSAVVGDKINSSVIADVITAVRKR